MTELVNLLPAAVGLTLGLVALVVSHLAARRLRAHREEMRNLKP